MAGGSTGLHELRRGEALGASGRAMSGVPRCSYCGIAMAVCMHEQRES